MNICSRTQVGVTEQAGGRGAETERHTDRRADS